MVDTIFADVAQPDQARIVAINAHHFLKNNGHIVISIKVYRYSKFIYSQRFLILELCFFKFAWKWFVMNWLQANCVDSTAEPEAVFAGEINKLKGEKIKPQEQLTLEPYERDHAVVVGVYR